MAILECAEIDDMYFVVTHHHDALQDPPYTLCLDDEWRVVEFDDG